MGTTDPSGLTQVCVYCTRIQEMKLLGEIYDFPKMIQIDNPIEKEYDKAKLSVLAEQLTNLSMDLVHLIVQYSDTMATTTLFVTTTFINGSITWYSAKDKIKEMKPGRICGECVEKKVNSGHLLRTDISPICSECNPPQPSISWQDFSQIIGIDFYLNYPTTQFLPHYRENRLGLIHAIDEKKAIKYRQHSINNKDCGLSEKLWICKTCWETTPKNPVLDIQCGQCKTLFPRLSIKDEVSDFCCIRLDFNSTQRTLPFKTKWDSGKDGEEKNLYFSDTITMGEARKLVDALICDNCIEGLFKDGKLILSDLPYLVESDSEVD